MLLTTQRPKCESQREGGATVVEAALVLPLFLALIFGIVEISLFLYDINAIRAGSRQGGRIASVSATDAYADFNALIASRQSLANMANKIDGVIIFRAPTAASPVPPECIAALDADLTTLAPKGVPDKCNVYNASQYWNLDQLNFGFDVGSNPDPTLWDSNWAPTGRNDAITETSNADFVGMWVRVVHHSATGIMPMKPLTATFVFQIEPQRAL